MSPKSRRQDPGYRYSLDELASLCGMTPRNVRAYTSRGLLDHPHRDGRTAYYDGAHLARLRLVQSLRGRGLPLQVIQVLVTTLPAIHLSRLAREQLGALGTTEQAKVSDQVSREVERQAPGSQEVLAELGVLIRASDGFLANPLLLAVSGALTPYLGIPAVMRIGEAAGHAARQANETLRPLLSRARDGRRRGAAPDDAGNLDWQARQLAVLAFADALTRLSRAARP